MGGHELDDKMLLLAMTFGQAADHHRETPHVSTTNEPAAGRPPGTGRVDVARCSACSAVSLDLVRLACPECGSTWLHYYVGDSVMGFSVWRNTTTPACEYWALDGWPLVVRPRGDVLVRPQTGRPLDDG